MKVLLLLVAVLVLFTSCKKDYTCTCSDIDIDVNGNPVDDTYVNTYTSLSAANANLLKADCESSRTINGSLYAGCVWDKK